MELLSSTRQEAVRQIREQLCCVLCARIFEDPQCLDCKHNFCRECIFLHLRKNNSYCPTCRLPTRPSEITRNQFLESILAAWKAVEVEIEHLGDPTCHETPITVADTDKALQSASAGSHLSPVAPAHSASAGGHAGLAGVSTPQSGRNGAAAHEGVALPMSMQSRGRVANNKWNVDTQGIRQQMRADQPYYFHPSPMGRSKSSSSDLPDDYGASEHANADATPSSNGTGQCKRRTGKAKRKLSVAAAACSLENASTEEYESDASRYREDHGSDLFSEDSGVSSVEDVSQASNSALLHTQDINSYLERINRQREALSQWERARRGKKLDPDAASPMTNLLRSRTSHALPRFQRSSLEGSDEDETEVKGETQTQFPLSTTAMDSPDLLSTTHMSAFDRLVSSARKSRRVDDDEDEGEDDDTVDADEWLRARLAKRRLDLASSSPPAAATRSNDQPHRRKRIRVPSSQSYDGDGASRIRVEATQLEMASDGSGVFVPDSQAALGEDEELETKPPVPLRFQDERTASASSPATVQLDHASRVSEKAKKTTKRISQDFEGAIKAFQAQQLHDQKPSSAAAATLMASSRGANAGGATASPPRIRNGILNAAMLRTVAATPPRAVKKEPTSLNRPPLPASSNGSTSAVGKKPAGERAFVLVGTDLSKEEVKRIMDACMRLGGRFGRHFDTKRNRKTGAELSSVTHLITKAVPPPFTSADGEPLDLPGLRCKRTAKYMQALAEGAFVVDMAWVSDSLSAGKWLPEEPYEMEGDMYSDAMGKPRESRLRRAQTGRRNDIFNMFRFVMLCQDEEFEYQLQSVRSVVETFGGVVNWAHEYDALPAEQRTRKTPIGIVSKSLPSWVAKTRWQQYQIPIVRVTWLFDSISHVEVLPFDDYYPY